MEERKNNILSEIFIKVFTVLGLLLIPTAIFMPFKIRDYYKTRIETYKTIADLGTIGDFIGGTTVALLTAASVFLLLATILMQRKEIKISQRSIDELVKQTDASVKQAKEAKKETQITNNTMKRQQFETTFFNMVSLHHNNTDKLSNDEFKGTEVVKDALENFFNHYHDLANKKFKESYINEDYQDVVQLIKFLQSIGAPEVRYVQTTIKAEVIDAFNDLDLERLFKAKVDKRMVKEFMSNIFQRPNEDIIKEAYYKVESKHDRFLSSYFNSIITILKFLSESTFEREDIQNGTQNNKIYREILFSQFTPYEMMMIYYFAKYSTSNEWLLEELKTYNLFYPRLSKTLYKFSLVDERNILELIGNSSTE